MLFARFSPIYKLCHGLNFWLGFPPPPNSRTPAPTYVAVGFNRYVGVGCPPRVRSAPCLGTLVSVTWGTRLLIGCRDFVFSLRCCRCRVHVCLEVVGLCPSFLFLFMPAILQCGVLFRKGRTLQNKSAAVAYIDSIPM